mmetsp:Transcript_43432/g.109994  ORF Transcript_43432/g.109994 Transcript_43432/m.109994 type:complete len:346 (-) Transcript_43432:2-1039(-)
MRAGCLQTSRCSMHEAVLKHAHARTLTKLTAQGRQVERTASTCQIARCDSNALGVKCQVREREEIFDVLEGADPGLDEEGRERVRLVHLHVVLRVLQLSLAHVLADGEGAAVDLDAALVHLVREDAVRGVHEGHDAVLGDAVDLVVVDLHLAQLLAHADALLLAAEVAQVLALVHDGPGASRQLDLGLLFCRPGDRVALLGVLRHVAARGARIEWELRGLEKVLGPRDVQVDRGALGTALHGARAARGGGTARGGDQDGGSDGRGGTEEATGHGGRCALGARDGGSPEVPSPGGGRAHEGVAAGQGAEEAQAEARAECDLCRGRHRRRSVEGGGRSEAMVREQHT